MRKTLLVLCVLLGLATLGQAQQSAQAEQELFRLMNQDRAQAGLGALEWNQWLAQAARDHCQEMVKRGQLSHQFPGEPGVRDRIAATQLRFNVSGENVAFGPSAAEVNDGWMHSPGHRANILKSKYDAVGVAVIRSGTVVYAVADFAHTLPAQTAGDIEDEVATAVNRRQAEEKRQPLPRREYPALRGFACDMAKQNKVNANSLLGKNNITATLAFTDSDPSQVGGHVRQAGDLSGFRSFAVGSCFARNHQYPEGTNWVVVVFY